MLQDLTVVNYRSLKEFKIDRLSQVNLIVGDNNSGKTSFLEALYLFLNKAQPILLFYLLELRGNITLLTENKKFYQIKNLFFESNDKQELFLNIFSVRGKDMSIKICIETLDTKEISLTPESWSLLGIPELQLSIFVDKKQIAKIPVFENGLLENPLEINLNFLNHLFSTSKYQFITTNKFSFNKLSMMWDKIALTSKEDKIIRALKILNSDIERLNFTNNSSDRSGIFFKIHNRENPIPIGNLGEGIHRILALAMKLVMVENGALLVDEIDIGLHYAAQTEMWKFVLEIAKQLNIQVFATTHSWDCICAFQEALAESEDSSIGQLFRLSRKDDTIKPVIYNADDLEIAVRQSIEVRCCLKDVNHRNPNPNNY
ncbi:AAA family ATPase [Oscillatoriales cyanobacterium LEGE 11467]|uniref:AAA family ATPase n=1 Tax=Zarconia navalis LEGE 11467 TaxID=1828826 RepID=A0A928W2Z4_9CYAN|nr:ATP-binding protein [Zarconia navalis]MBE9042305.1 AAA family ATPase [Zarconia navalis LEGE 11467]